jgi:hypothetical protein
MIGYAKEGMQTMITKHAIPIANAFSIVYAPLNTVAGSTTSSSTTMDPTLGCNIILLCGDDQYV